MEINLSMIWEIFLRRLWIIVLGFVMAASGAYAYCEYIATPEYKATASILVTNGAITTDSESDIKSTVASTDITASLDLADTVTDILETTEAYRKAAEASNGKYTYGSIVGTAKITKSDNASLFVNISFTNSNTEKAIDLANLFAKTSCEYITEVIPYSKASVVAKSVKADLVYPRTLMTMAISGVIAAVVFFVIFFLIENNNRIIRSEEDFTKHFNIPIIGSVPDFESSETGSYATYKKGK